MRSDTARKLSLIVVVALLLSGILACDFGGGAGEEKPRVIVASPESGVEIPVGQDAEIISIAEDSKGVVSIDLAVDGVLYATEYSPTAGGDQQWRLVETWTANVAPGTHTLTITAWNVDKVASDPAIIYVTVVAGAGPAGTGTVTEATSTPAFPGATATLPPAGSTATTTPPAPTRTAAAAPPTNTPVPPPPTNTHMPPPPPTNTPVPPPPGQPDLTIRELYVDPANPANGAYGTAYFTIRNRGNAQAGQSVLYYQWGPGGNEVGQAQIPALAAGAEHSLGANVGPFYGSFSLWGIIDAGSAVTESNEDNNRREFMVNVAQAYPDLIVPGIKLSADSILSGDTLFAQIGARNVGNASAGPFHVTWQYGSGDFDICAWVVPGLNAQEETTLECTTAPLYSSYSTLAIVDSGGWVQESDEGNNTLERWVQVEY